MASSAAKAIWPVSDTSTLRDYEALLETAGFFGAQTGSPATSITVTDAARADLSRDKDLILLGSPATHRLLEAWTARQPLARSLAIS